MQTLEAPPQEPKTYDIEKELAAQQEAARKAREAVRVEVSDAGNLVELKIKTQTQAHSLALSPAQALDLGKALRAAANKINRRAFENAAKERREKARKNNGKAKERQRQ